MIKYCLPEQKYYPVSTTQVFFAVHSRSIILCHPGVLDKSCNASIPCFSGQAAAIEHQAEPDSRTWGCDCAAVWFGQQPCPDTDQWWVWNCEKSGLSYYRRKLLPCFSGSYLIFPVLQFIICCTFCLFFYSKAATHLLCLIKGQRLTWDSFFLFAWELTHLYWFAPKTSSPAGS